MHRMQRAEQMAVLGQLSAGLAHEIKNPLAGIKAAMEVLSADERLSAEDREVLRRVGHEVTRLETLMKSFLNFAKPPKPQLTEIEVDSLVEMTLGFQERGERMKPDAPNRVVIRRDFNAPPATLADPMQLQQVLLNLVLNAVDAMPSGGVLTVRTAYEKDPETIVIEVADAGKGIDHAHAAKMFEPFFTTKPKGTGLGLAISRQLIEQHGGTIGFAPNPGGGTRFTIRLPRRTNGQEDRP
jgi:two-component system sensor histidine kinase AtoS